MLSIRYKPEQLTALSDLNVALARAVESGIVDRMKTAHRETVLDFMHAAGALIDDLEKHLRETKDYQGCPCTFRQWLLGVASDPTKRLHCEARAYMSAGGNTDSKHDRSEHDPQAIANNY